MRARKDGGAAGEGEGTARPLPHTTLNGPTKHAARRLCFNVDTVGSKRRAKKSRTVRRPRHPKPTEDAQTRASHNQDQVHR